MNKTSAEAIPARWEWKYDVTSDINNGPRKAVIFPDKDKYPNISERLEGVDMMVTSVLDADWIGPIKLEQKSPQM